MQKVAGGIVEGMPGVNTYIVEHPTKRTIATDAHSQGGL